MRDSSSSSQYSTSSSSTTSTFTSLSGARRNSDSDSGNSLKIRSSKKLQVVLSAGSSSSSDEAIQPVKPVQQIIRYRRPSSKRQLKGSALNLLDNLLQEVTKKFEGLDANILSYTKLLSGTLTDIRTLQLNQAELFRSQKQKQSNTLAVITEEPRSTKENKDEQKRDKSKNSLRRSQSCEPTNRSERPQ